MGYVITTRTMFLLLVAMSGLPAYSQARFDGRVAVEWLTGASPERDMKLLEPFSFWDQHGKLWSVPAGAVINGASIPQAFWTLAGSPYTDKYRRASVVHDYYCDMKSQPWESVHRMFFDAMILGGVGEIEAKIFYGFVYAGGPRWKSIVTRNFEGTEETIVVPLTPAVPTAVQDDATAWIKATNPSLSEIEERLKGAIVVR